MTCIVGTVIGNLDLFTVFLPSIAMAAACLNEYISAAGAAAWAASLHRKQKGGQVFHNAACAERAAEIQVLYLRSSAALKRYLSMPIMKEILMKRFRRKRNIYPAGFYI